MRRLLIFLLSVVSVLALAQELWLQPGKYLYQVGEMLTLSFREGENFAGTSWDITTHKIEKLELHQRTGVTTLRDRVSAGTKDNVSIALQQEGICLLTLQSSAAFIDLEAEKFNTYLKEYGLDDVYDQREKKNQLAADGKELFSHHAKLLVQVGSKTDDTWKKAVGFPAEIVPLQDPYSLKIGDRIQFKVLYQGKPVFGARVKVWNRYKNRTTLQNIYSEQNGVIETTLSIPGEWMVAYVKMVPSKSAEAEWQSYRTSLTFGIK